MAPTEQEPAAADDVTEDAVTGDAGESSEDVRRKFREALDRKHQQHAAGAAGADGRDPSKVHDAHGPAASRRSFRRKSG